MVMGSASLPWNQREREVIGERFRAQAARADRGLVLERGVFQIAHVEDLQDTPSKNAKSA
jgi:hypothetical protein